MRCSNCGKRLVQKTGLYISENEYLGCISVDLQDSHECRDCEDVYLSWKDVGRLEQAENDVQERLLKRRPVSDFVTQKETAEMLGITKQAVSKNGRIKRGFIFHTEFDGRKMYLRDSVELYKKTGDGRFSLDVRSTQMLQIKGILPEKELFSDVFQQTFEGSFQLMPNRLENQQLIFLSRSNKKNTTLKIADWATESGTPEACSFFIK